MKNIPHQGFHSFIPQTFIEYNYLQLTAYSYVVDKVAEAKLKAKKLPVIKRIKTQAISLENIFVKML